MENESYTNEKSELPPYNQTDMNTPYPSDNPSMQNQPNSVPMHYQQNPVPMYNQPNLVPMYNQPGVGVVTVAPPPPQNQVVLVTQTTNDSSGMQSTIPILPMPVAIILCITNILLPGFGTIVAAWCVFCCARSQTPSSACSLFCINFWIGWAQLLTIWLLLFGWVWSIIWGIYFISNSANYYGKTIPQPATTVTTQVAGQPQQHQPTVATGPPATQ